MTEEEYKKLCFVCDEVLLSSDATIERISIPWLHVIREHPLFLTNYTGLFGLESVKLRFKRTMKYLAGWIRQFYMAATTCEKMLETSDKIEAPIDILFISHYLNSSQSGKSDDFYFGPVPRELASKGYSVVISLINHSYERGAIVAGKWKGSEVKRIVFSKAFGLIRHIKLFNRMWKESRLLGYAASKSKSGILKKVLFRSSSEAISGSTRNTIGIYQQISQVMLLYQPRIIVVTYEGHAWERLAFFAARELNPFVKCIGYQHSALFRMQHAIRRKLTAQFNPDYIFTSGIIAKSQLEKASGLMGIPLSVLGSNRGFEANNCVDKPEDLKKSVNNICIVLPEADVIECNLLFSFSIDCAIQCPSIQFLWRLHPLVTFQTLIAQNDKFSDLPPNIVLSKSLLEEDLVNSRWALYRGTTTIIQAVGAGAQPVYLSVAGEMSIDPLYEIDAWKRKVSDVTTFIQIIEAEKLHINFAEKKSLETYCANFFSKFSTDVLLPLLES